MEKDIQENIADMVVTGLLFSTKAHLWHFNSKTYSRHIAYGELYNGVREGIDRLAEAAMGAGADLSNSDRLEFEPVPETGSVDDTKALVDYFNDVREDLAEAGYDALVTIIDDIVATILQVIYKLERLA